MERPRRRKARTVNVLQSILAAGGAGLFVGDLEGDLREGKRQQREVEAPSAQDDRADDEREQGGEDSCEQERRQVVAVAAQDEECSRVAGAAEEHRRTEGNEAGVADEQVNAGAIERVDGNLRDQRVRGADQRPDRGERSQNKRGDDGGMPQRCEVSHSNLSQRSPKRPRGRTRRMTAMRTYM